MRTFVIALALLLGAIAVAEAEVSVLVTGSSLQSANGIAFGPDGTLYVSSSGGRAIWLVDPSDGRILERRGPETGLDSPNAIAIAADGSLYWSDILIGEVGRRSADGEVTKQFVAPGVNALTFAPDGRLFASINYQGDGLVELDPLLLGAPRPIVVASEENPYPLGFLNVFDFGPDGRLYGPLHAAGMLIGFDVDSCEATSDPWADCDIRVLGDDFNMPVSATFDARGRLHLVDQPGTVFIVDIVSGERSVLVADLPPMIHCLAFDAAGDLFVTNYVEGAIYRIAPDGTWRVVSPGGLIAPQGIVVVEGPDGGEFLFVADNYSLRTFDAASGRHVRTVPTAELKPGLAYPHTVARHGDDLVISSPFKGVVQIWDPRTETVVEQHPLPFTINVIAFQDDLVVIDLVLGGVVWADTGEMILPIDQQQIYLPSGLATDGERLWVSDWATGIVWQLAFDGRTALEPVPVAFELANPEGLALDHQGGLLVVEEGAGRLSRVELASGEVHVIAEGLALGSSGSPVLPPSWLFSGVAVGADGVIYVTSDVDSAIYRIVRR